MLINRMPCIPSVVGLKPTNELTGLSLCPYFVSFVAVCNPEKKNALNIKK